MWVWNIRDIGSFQLQIGLVRSAGDFRIRNATRTTHNVEKGKDNTHGASGYGVYVYLMHEQVIESENRSSNIWRCDWSEMVLELET